ncbi:hypothetical protein Q1695_002061 [Nippostrongylus brasiliensis]|nr:hypothetical protein Q1695_002061 [Nippostrongylus brasiliensis]
MVAGFRKSNTKSQPRDDDDREGVRHRTDNHELDGCETSPKQKTPKKISTRTKRLTQSLPLSAAIDANSEFTFDIEGERRGSAGSGFFVEGPAEDEAEATDEEGRKGVAGPDEKTSKVADSEVTQKSANRSDKDALLHREETANLKDTSTVKCPSATIEQSALASPIKDTHMVQESAANVEFTGTEQRLDVSFSFSAKTKGKARRRVSSKGSKAKKGAPPSMAPLTMDNTMITQKVSASAAEIKLSGREQHQDASHFISDTVKANIDKKVSSKTSKAVQKGSTLKDPHTEDQMVPESSTDFELSGSEQHQGASFSTADTVKANIDKKISSKTSKAGQKGSTSKGPHTEDQMVPESTTELELSGSEQHGDVSHFISDTSKANIDRKIPSKAGQKGSTAKAPHIEGQMVPESSTDVELSGSEQHQDVSHSISDTSKANIDKKIRSKASKVGQKGSSSKGPHTEGQMVPESTTELELSGSEQHDDASHFIPDTSKANIDRKIPFKAGQKGSTAKSPHIEGQMVPESTTDLELSGSEQHQDVSHSISDTSKANIDKKIRSKASKVGQKSSTSKCQHTEGQMVPESSADVELLGEEQRQDASHLISDTSKANINKKISSKASKVGQKGSSSKGPHTEGQMVPESSTDVELWGSEQHQDVSHSIADSSKSLTTKNVQSKVSKSSHKAPSTALKDKESHMVPESSTDVELSGIEQHQDVSQSVSDSSKSHIGKTISSRTSKPSKKGKEVQEVSESATDVEFSGSERCQDVSHSISDGSKAMIAKNVRSKMPGAKRNKTSLNGPQTKDVEELSEVGTDVELSGKEQHQNVSHSMSDRSKANIVKKIPSRTSKADQRGSSLNDPSRKDIEVVPESSTDVELSGSERNEGVSHSISGTSKANIDMKVLSNASGETIRTPKVERLSDPEASRKQQVKSRDVKKPSKPKRVEEVLKREATLTEESDIDCNTNLRRETDDGSTSEMDDGACSVTLPTVLTLKVAQTFSVPNRRGPEPGPEGVSGAKSPKAKPKALPKYLSDETEKLLKKKALAAERAKADLSSEDSDGLVRQGKPSRAPTKGKQSKALNKVRDSDVDFANQSTDQMVEPFEQETGVEQSDNEIFQAQKKQALERMTILSSAKNADESADEKLRAPLFRHKQQSVKCIFGQPLCVKSYFTGYPEPTISVYHNDDLVCVNSANLVQEGEGLYSFTFSLDSAHFEDGGKLTVKAKNQFGSDQCITHIEIVDDRGEKFWNFDPDTLFEREFEAAEITMAVTDVAVAEGETARLHGKLCGYPFPEVIWLKNGVEIDPEQNPDKYRFDVREDGSFTMEIANCSPDDDDVYSLLVENMAAVDSCGFLVVERPNPNAPRLTQCVAPRFATVLADRDAVVGEQVVMEVTTQGAPAPLVRFYRDGQLLADNDQYEVRHETEPVYKHTLILKSIDKAEDGEYACQAINPAGEAWCYSDLFVRSSSDRSKDAMVTTGAQNDSSVEKTLPQAAAQKQEVRSDIQSQFGVDAEEVKPVKKVAEKPKASKKSKAKKQSETKEAPTKIIKPLSPRTIGKEGESLTLRAELNHPDEDVIWTKDGKPIADSTKCSINTENTSVTLTIENPDVTDAGEYTVAVNGSECATNLVVLGKPRIKPIEVKVVEIEKGDDIVIDVAFECHEIPTASCSFNGSPLREDAKTQLEIQDRKVKLRKRQATKADSGEYIVKLSNEYGNVEKVIRVKVKDVPGPPSSISVNEVKTESVSISWEKPSDDSDQAITAYLIEKKEEGCEAFVKVAQVSGMSNAFILEKPHSSAVTVLRVSAVNKYGIGEAIETSTAIKTAKASKNSLSRTNEDSHKRDMSKEKAETRESRSQEGKKMLKDSKLSEAPVSEPSLTHREPSPDTEGKKKKNVPKSLVIPSQISSRFGDPSVMLSEANITASLAAVEESAEADSPIKQPQSATITMKVRSVNSTPVEAAEFNFKQGEQVKGEGEESSSLKLRSRSGERDGLPPKGGITRKDKKKVKDEQPIPSEESNTAKESPEKDGKKDVSSTTTLKKKDEERAKTRKADELKSGKDTSAETTLTAELSKIGQHQEVELVIVLTESDREENTFKKEVEEKYVSKDEKKSAKSSEEKNAEQSRGRTARVKEAIQSATKEESADQGFDKAESAFSKEDAKGQSAEKKKERSKSKENVVERQISDAGSVEKKEKSVTESLSEENALYKGKKIVRSSDQAVTVATTKGSATFHEEDTMDGRQEHKDSAETKATSELSDNKPVDQEVVKSEKTVKRKAKKGVAAGAGEAPCLEEGAPKNAGFHVKDTSAERAELNHLDQGIEHDFCAAELNHLENHIKLGDEGVAKGEKTVRQKAKKGTAAGAGEAAHSEKSAPENEGVESLPSISQKKPKAISTKTTKPLSPKTIGKEGESLTLRAELNHPDEDVVWTKDGKPIAGSAKCSINTENTSVTLTIENPDVTDAGEYTIAVNGSECATNLVVLGKPKIKPSEVEVVEIEKGDDVVIDVAFECHEIPTASCSFNGSPLREDAKTQLEIQDKKVKLRRRQATKADSGEYIVKLSNEYGNVKKVIRVKVKDVPGPPSSISVNEVESDTVSISWEKPSDGSDQAITAYLIEKKEEGCEAFVKVAQVSGTSSTIILENKDSTADCVLRVSAVNKYGAGEPIETSVKNYLPSGGSKATEDFKKALSEANEARHKKDVDKAKAETRESRSQEGKKTLKDSKLSEAPTSEPSLTQREPSPDAEGKKKKNVPKSLVIPSQISSRFGDPSVMLSEANITASLAAAEESAEADSPIKQPQSATITMKVRSVNSTPVEAADFNFKQGEQGKGEYEESSSLKLRSKSDERDELPPKAGIARKGEKKVKDERPILPEESSSVKESSESSGEKKETSSTISKPKGEKHLRSTKDDKIRFVGDKLAEASTTAELSKNDDQLQAELVLSHSEADKEEKTVEKGSQKRKSSLAKAKSTNSEDETSTRNLVKTVTFEGYAELELTDELMEGSRGKEKQDNHHESSAKLDESVQEKNRALIGEPGPDLESLEVSRVRVIQKDELLEDEQLDVTEELSDGRDQSTMDSKVVEVISAKNRLEGLEVDDQRLKNKAEIQGKSPEAASDFVAGVAFERTNHENLIEEGTDHDFRDVEQNQLENHTELGDEGVVKGERTARRKTKKGAATGAGEAAHLEEGAPENEEVESLTRISQKKPQAKDVPTKITKPLSPKTIGKEGESLTLRAELNHPDEDVIWTKDGKPIADSSKCSINTENTSVTLTIENPDVTDAGEYTIAVNGSECATNLVVLGKPRIKPSEVKVVEIEKGDDVVIDVVFDCHEIPTASCSFNGSPLREDAKTELEIQDKKVKLRKRQATKADSGEYIVNLSNEYGNVEKVFKVKVKDVPGPPSSISVDEVKTESVSVSWEKPSDTSDLPITAYVIEKKEEGRRKFQKVVQVSGASTSYVVEDLENSSSYVFRVTAVNKFGAGEPVETPVVVTGSSIRAPIIEQQPVICDITADGCVLSWTKPSDDGGAAIYGYDVYCREEGGDWVKINSELVFAERYVVRGLRPGVRYEFKTEATNEKGVKSNSDVVSEPLLIKPLGGRPTSILPIPRITVSGVDSVTVEWDVPEEEDSSEFTVSYKSEGSSVWSEVSCDANFCKIDGLKQDVSYVFRVALKNENGVGDFSEATQPVKVAVDAEPVVIKSIRDTEVARKQDLRLECHASGHPAPEFIWYKDGDEIIPADDRVQITNDGYMSRLTIADVESDDRGSYTCEVSNPLGTSKTTADVAVTDVRCHFVSSFSELTEASEGQDIDLRCTVSDEDGAVLWLKDNKPVKESDRVIVQAEGAERTLKLLKAAASDSGSYRCETSDGRSRAEGKLIVEEEDAHISVGPQDVTVRQLGSEMALRCELTRPVNRVQWFKNGIEIWPQASKFIMTTSGCSSTLEIRNFEKTDIGNYTAALNDKEVSAPAHVTLEVAPEVKIREDLEEELVLQAHEELMFHVEVEGHPLPSLTVLHKGVRIQTRATVEEYDNVMSIRMKDLARDDCGVVKITAENEFGVAEREIRLTVIDVPSEPLSLSASGTTVDSTKLSWSHPEKTNGAPVTAFVIERKAVDSNRWRQIGKTNGNTLEFEATELFSNQVYGFRIIAVNSAGQGPPSQSIDVLTLEESQKKIDSEKAIVTGSTDEAGEVELLPSIQEGVEIGKIPEGREKSPKMDGESRDSVRALPVEWPDDVPKSQPRKFSSPVDDIVNTKQRLKKRKPETGDRKGSISQGSDNSQPQSPSFMTKKRTDVENDEATAKQGGIKPSQGIISEVSVSSDTLDGSTADFKNSDALLAKQGRKDGNEADLSATGAFGLKASSADDGITSADDRLLVKSKPSAPEGPLEVAYIGNKCRLSWSAPLDDGHSELLGYVVEMFDEPTKSWRLLGRCASNVHLIDHLPPGKSHRFRVSAENAIGVGTPIESEEKVEDTKASPPPRLEKPSVSSSAGSITATWKPLEGVEDVSYVVEIREANSRRSWKVATADPIRSNSFTIPNLKLGTEYVVRVAAVTPAGRGPSSTESQVVKCEDDRVSAPTFVNKPADVIVVKGARTKVTAEFTGCPQPEVQWMKNRKEIFSGNRMWIETLNGVSALSIADMRDDDEAEYTVVLRNEHGICEHKFQLNVDAQPEIIRPDRYAAALVYDEGETVKLRLSFTGAK